MITRPERAEPRRQARRVSVQRPAPREPACRTGNMAVSGTHRHANHRESWSETEQHPQHLAEQRLRRQRLVQHPEQLLRRGHGAPGLGFAVRRSAARGDRLPDGGDHVAGHLHHRRHAHRARALERPGAHHEDARCRRVRDHLPDDQLARRGRALRRRLPLRSGRLPQLGPDPGRAVGRRRLSREGQRRRADLRDDRDRRSGHATSTRS